MFTFSNVLGWIRSINGSRNNGVDRNAVIQLQHWSVKLAFTASCLLVRPKECKLSVPKHGRTDSGRANTQSEHFGQTSRSQLSKYVGVSLCFQRQKVCCVHSHLRAIVLNNWTREKCGVQFYWQFVRQSTRFPVFSPCLARLLLKGKLNHDFVRIFYSLSVVFKMAAVLL